MADAFELKDDGHILVTINDVLYDCRPPKGQEYFLLRAGATELQKVLSDLVADEDIEGIDSDRKVYEATGNWIILMINTLATPFTGTLEDFPPWFLSGVEVRDALTHWLTRPLVPPGR